MRAHGGWWSVGALLVGSFAASCGGSRQNEAKEPTAQTPVAAAPETEAVLPAVEAPPGTFLWGRLKNPARLTDLLADAPRLRLRAVGSLPTRLSKVLRAADLGAPVEVAVAVPDQGGLPVAIVSWGVTSEDGVLAELAQLDVEAMEAPGGTHRFVLRGAPCVLGPAAGPLPARVACGEDVQAVDLLGDFALRGLPRQPLSDAEAHVELVAAPLQRAYGRDIGSLKMLAPMAVRQLQIDSPRFDRAVADAVFGLLDEVLALSEEVDGARLQVWNKGDGYELSLSGRIRKGSSWSAETLHSLGQRQTIPPAWFWTLPSSTSVALFGQSAPEASARAPWKVLTDALLGYLESEGLSAATSARLERWRDDAFELGATQVAASGPLVPATTTGGLEEPAWHLAGAQRDSAGYRKLLDELVAILGEKDLRQVADKGVDWLPTLKRRGALPRHPGSVVVEWEASRSPLALLDRVEALVALGGQVPLLDGMGSREDATQKGFFAIVPDGERTWLAWADTLERLGEPFARMGAEGSPNLKQVPGLTGLQENPAFVTGFVKVEQVFELASARGASWEQVRSSLPHGGKIPLTFEARVVGGEPVEVELLQRIPEEFLEDLLRALQTR